MPSGNVTIEVPFPPWRIRVDCSDVKRALAGDEPVVWEGVAETSLGREGVTVSLLYENGVLYACLDREDYGFVGCWEQKPSVVRACR